MWNLLFKGLVETQDGLALGSGSCSVQQNCEGSAESSVAPAAVRLIFHSITACYKELWAWELNTGLVPSAFHQVAAARSYVLPKPDTSLASLSPQTHTLKGQLRTRSERGYRTQIKGGSPIVSAFQSSGCGSLSKCEEERSALMKMLMRGLKEEFEK